MVTTRHQKRGSLALDPQSDGELTIVVNTPEARPAKRTRKSKSESSSKAPSLETPTKKQRKLPVRGKDSDRDDSDVRGAGLDDRAQGTSPLADSGPETAVEGIQDADVDGGREEDVEKLSPGHPQHHKRFDSQEPEEDLETTESTFMTARESINSSEGSDGDVPEVVATGDAFKSAKLREREAAHALELQQSAIRQKRRERDAALKSQAKSGNKKRKRIEEVDVEQQDTTIDPVHSISGDVDQNPAEGAKPPNDILSRTSNIPNPERMADEAVPSGENVQRSAKRAKLPDLLPAEYLEDDDNDKDEFAKPAVGELLVKKVRTKKVATHLDQRPKDRRVGSTTYRVAGPAKDTHLAPRAAWRARHLKESWIQGRQGSRTGTARKPYSKGFFVPMK